MRSRNHRIAFPAASDPAILLRVSALPLQSSEFLLTVEVLPPAGPDTATKLASLEAFRGLSFHAFSIPSNPVAGAYLDALAFCGLVQRATGRATILHCTTRDHNRLSLQGLLWGARASGVETILAATGDMIALKRRGTTTTVQDLEVFGLVRLGRDSGLQVGVVLDPRPETGGLPRQVERLRRKADAGAQFVVTQPVFDRGEAQRLAEALEGIPLPVLLGILPLRSARQALFLQEHVAGITIPEAVRRRLEIAAEPEQEGISLAREMLGEARRLFAGACLMPVAGHYETVARILG
jgi:methylenetetrahydrofolate reductase (NADPH)